MTRPLPVGSKRSNGIGEPSPISPPVRTKPIGPSTTGDGGPLLMAHELDLQLARQRLGAEQIVRLQEVKLINATAVKLTWKVRIFIAFFIIRTVIDF